MTCSVFASAVFTAGGVGWGSTRAAPGYLGLPAKFSAGFGRASFGGQGLSLRSFRLPGFVTIGKRTPGIVYATAATERSVHDFTVKDIDGKDISLSKFKGKILLIVNVASQCGFTTSNYTELSHLYENYKNQGFEILAFPCNQFGGQEPGSNPEIKQFACTKFKAEFPIFDKVDVNGQKTAPIYQFLKASAGGFLGDLIKWNFEKFLIDKNGKVVERYPPTTSPFQIEVSFQSTGSFCCQPVQAGNYKALNEVWHCAVHPQQCIDAFEPVISTRATVSCNASLTDFTNRSAWVLFDLSNMFLLLYS